MKMDLEIGKKEDLLIDKILMDMKIEDSNAFDYLVEALIYGQNQIVKKNRKRR